MEIIWKILNLCVGLSLVGLGNGLPINPENIVSDSRAHFLTCLIAVILIICSIVFLAGCICCPRSNGFKEFKDSAAVAAVSSESDGGHVNPINNTEFTIFTPLSPPHHNNNVFSANPQIICQTHEEYVCEDLDVNFWFNEKEKDFPRTKLKYIRELGKGWFGRIVEGAAQDLTDDQNWTPVAVRILEATATSKEKVLFLQDISIYKCGNHPNILQLLGRCLDCVPFLLLQEYCSQGDLKNYLFENRSTSEKILCSELPLQWCCQITSALKFLHTQKVMHPDLATRSCQLSSDLNVKLGDYGINVNKYPQDYYQGASGVSVRWCAPELLTYTSTTIQPKKVTMEGNIWSLGVTMWEICECGKQPYIWLNDDEVISQVLGPQKVRLPKPSFSVGYTDYIYNLMQLCWTTAELRPTAVEIDMMLVDLFEVYKNVKNSSCTNGPMCAEHFERRWATFKPNSIVKTDNQTIAVNIVKKDLADNTKNLVHSKHLSLSLNNLHGSLDNLFQSVSTNPSNTQMDSWLENVASATGDMSYVQGLSEAIKDLDNTLASENVSSPDSSPAQQTSLHTEKVKIEFKLGPLNKVPEINSIITEVDSLTDSMLFVQKVSSESETEDENWKKKIERGAYSEKVRQKSRSVTDLMVLTHIDCSESDSETPLPSLDYKRNKNVWYGQKQNLENVSLMFNSEGNLLSMQNTFQDELKKLQEERRDSMLFVPDKLYHNDNCVIKLDKLEKECTTTTQNNNEACMQNLSAKKLIEELNSTAKMKPINQIYNVFNVTIDSKFSPVQKSRFINNTFENNDNLNNCVPKLSHLIQSDVRLIDYIALKNVVCGKDKNLIELNRRKEKKKQNTNLNYCHCSSEISNDNENARFIINVPALSDQHQISCELADFTTSNSIERKIETSESNTSTSLMSDVNCSVKKIIEEHGCHHNCLNDELICCTTNLAKDRGSVNESNTCKRCDVPFKTFHDICVSTHFFLKAERENCDFNYCQDYSKNNTEFNLDKMINVPNNSFKPKIFTSVPCVESNSHCFTQSYENCNGYENEMLKFSSDFTQEPYISECDDQNYKENFNYSLETWDNFLGRALENQNETNIELFDSFTLEPHSLLFDEQQQPSNCINSNFHVDNEVKRLADNRFISKTETESVDNVNTTNTSFETDINNTFIVVNHQLDENTFMIEKQLNEAIIEQASTANNNDVFNSEDINFEAQLIPKTEDAKTSVADGWNSGGGGGWFLHLQPDDKCASGQMDTQNFNESNYNITIDDEIVAAIRNELLTKLPHAQGGASELLHEREELENNDKNEIFFRYNVYNTPLSPIPEENCSEPNSNHYSAGNGQNYDSCAVELAEQENNFSPNQVLNDTEVQPVLYQNNKQQANVEEPVCVDNDNGSVEFSKNNSYPESQRKINASNKRIVEKVDISTDQPLEKTASEISESKLLLAINETDKVDKATLKTECTKYNITDFINHKINLSNTFKQTEYIEPDLNRLYSGFLANTSNVNIMKFGNKHIAPLPSPEDIPWKQLPASMLSYEQIVPKNNEKQRLSPTESTNSDRDEINDEKKIAVYNLIHDGTNGTELDNVDYVNIHSRKETDNLGDRANNCLNQSDNLSINNMENTKSNVNCINAINSFDYNNHSGEDKELDYVNKFEVDEITTTSEPDLNDSDGLYGVLTDIRFSGPSDNQLMSTSFSESSNAFGEEQDWDSGSDTRSSSSGEFIWKEGEHEESVKALHAAEQDVCTEDITPMGDIQEDDSSQCTGSEDDNEEEEGECPEFIPSAWDKYATPTKSALRSPEKALENPELEKKPKVVWFKKQKYHCVYEYPREPESPVLQSYDLWKPMCDYHAFGNWEFDIDPYVPAVLDNFDSAQDYYQAHKQTNKLYQLTSVPDLGESNDFFVSGIARPFNLNCSTSQFFPGQNIADQWAQLTKQASENATPDSAIIEDITTPSDITYVKYILQSSKTVQPLKILAAAAVKKAQISETKSGDVLGGLRHTRNKLKLDLPPSPTAFSSKKAFDVESHVDSVMSKTPTFTTFGKSRFLVQHVDTPPIDDPTEMPKNVLFEVLPHKPLQKGFILDNANTNFDKVEAVRGEASLLDSADEDSGIESNTLEKCEISFIE